MILIDSDVLIEVIRGRDDGILQAWQRLASGMEVLACSPVAIAEIWHGARTNERAALASLFRALLSIPIDEEIGQQAGEYLSRFFRSHGLQLGDALIAATASIHGAELWTRNRKHFPMKEVSFFAG